MKPMFFHTNCFFLANRHHESEDVPSHVAFFAPWQWWHAFMSARLRHRSSPRAHPSPSRSAFFYSVERKNSPGGTSRSSVAAQIKTVRDYVASLPTTAA